MAIFRRFSHPGFVIFCILIFNFFNGVEIEAIQGAQNGLPPVVIPPQGSPLGPPNGGVLPIVVPIFTLECPDPNPEGVDRFFGRAVTGGADLNNDQKNEIGVGSLLWNKFYLFSGNDGSSLGDVQGETSDEFFGYSVDFLGDIDGDGVSDFIVGAPLYGEREGRIYVFSGAIDNDPFNLIYSISGEEPNFTFGSMVRGVGDIDGDNISDFIVVAPFDNVFPTPFENTAKLYAFSGATGDQLYRIEFETLGYFGLAIDQLGDVNQDGLSDFVVGIPYGTDERGRVLVINGNNGGTLFEQTGGIGEFFGISVSFVGDLNQDNISDYMAGAPVASNDRGVVSVFSGLSGSVLFTFEGENEGDYLGYGLASTMDRNRDGVRELLIGASGYDSGALEDVGRVYVVSGKTGRYLSTDTGQDEFDVFGSYISDLGDINGDGLGNFIIGSPYTNSDLGLAFVY